MLTIKNYKLILCFTLMVIIFMSQFTYASNLSESEKLYQSGNAYIEQRQYEAAIASYTQAIALNPEYAKAYNNRGIARKMEYRYDLAIIDFSKAIELDPQDADYYYNRGRSYRMQVKYKLSLDDFNKAIELNPQDTDYYLERAHAYECTGPLFSLEPYRLAVDDYNRVLTIDPNNGKAYSEKYRIIRYGGGELYYYYDGNIRDTSYNPFRR